MLPFEVQVVTSLIAQSAGALRALRGVNTYDYVIFTSKNAERLFREKMRSLRVQNISKNKIIRVGPRTDLLKLPLKGKRVLFPRSNLAPFDIVRALRRQGVVVHPVALYTARGRRLTELERHTLLTGKIEQLYFKSPSGVMSLQKQFRGQNRRTIQRIPALCIGETTARAAKKAGWKKITIQKVV